MLHRVGGMQLTCTTLATFTKYPRESFLSKTILKGYKGKSMQKYGFFQSEKELFTEVAETVGLIRRHPKAAWWCRHPLTFLMEAADDICYSIVDLEDGFHMGYLPFVEVRDLLNAIAKIDLTEYDSSPEETIKRLRAKAINQLVSEIAQIFLDKESEILAGKFDQALLSLSCYADILSIIEEKTAHFVFHHPNVVKVKVAGYEVLGELLTEFLTAIFHPTKKGKLITYILPTEWRPKPEESHYQKMLKVTDYISGLTDLQATLLFQQFRGISLGS
jgi:dGTPase